MRAYERALAYYEGRSPKLAYALWSVRLEQAESPFDDDSCHGFVTILGFKPLKRHCFLYL